MVKRTMDDWVADFDFVDIPARPVRPSATSLVASIRTGEGPIQWLCLSAWCAPVPEYRGHAPALGSNMQEMLLWAWGDLLEDVIETLMVSGVVGR